MFEQFIDMIGWEMLGGVALLLVVTFRNRGSLFALIPSQENTPKNLTNYEREIEELKALEGLEQRAKRLNNDELKKACKTFRHQWHVDQNAEGTVENA